VDRACGRVIERLGKIDAANFTADGGFRGHDLDLISRR
jgi:hypothetical protein